jgi:alpha-mannosidase
MAETKESCDISVVRETWEVADVKVVEKGPLCARLWVRLRGSQSWLDLTCTLTAGQRHMDVAARLLWNERGARLKLVMPGGDQACYQVPGATIERTPCGEVPGGRWVRVGTAAAGFGFVSDALYGFDCKAGEFRASVVRSAHYSQSHPEPATDPAWLPATDVGEHKFTFRLTPYDADLDRAAAELERPPTVITTPSSPGTRPRQDSLAAISPSSVKVLALKRAEADDSLILQVQNIRDKPAVTRFTWQGQNLSLGELAPWRLAAWRLVRLGGIWSATATDLSEV